MYIKETVTAGRVTEVRKYFTTRIHTKGAKRKRRSKPTPEAVRQINHRNTIRRLRWDLNANFQGGDIFATLTFRVKDRPEREEMDKLAKRFLRRLRNAYKRQGVELKYILVVEYKQAVIHYHLICNYIDTRIIEKAWPHGRVLFKHLDDTGQYGKLAEYLLKEKVTDYDKYRRPEEKHKKKYWSSQNLKKPTIVKEVIQAKKWKEPPKAIKGYKLEDEKTQIGFHDYTGWPFMFYSMVRQC